jgi:putative N-acetylmannosamine-6-phosphate epimerase
MQELNAEIIRLLIEESHLRAAKRTIQANLDERRAALEALKATRSPMDFVLGALKKSRALPLEIEALAKEIEDMERAVAKIEAMETRSTEQLEDELDAFIRVSSEEYRRGLAAVTSIADWERALDRFQDKLSVYLRSLGEARNTVVAGYDRDKKRPSNSGIEALRLAIEAGAALEAETHFANQIADLHRETVRLTPCQAAVIPSIPSADYSYWTKRLPEMEISTMQQEFNRILGMCEELAKNGISILREAVLHTRSEQSRLARDFIGNYLASLRAYTDENWFAPQHTEEVVRRIEENEAEAKLLGVPPKARRASAG